MVRIRVWPFVWCPAYDNPDKSQTIRGFTVTDAQRADLVAFLQSLTDDDLLHDPRFANPWTSPARH